MKCPHCGMNIRDDTTECGYCGGKITRRKEKAPADTGRFTVPRSGAGQKSASSLKTMADESESDEAEEEGGLSAILQSGERVLIGSLNVSVKKFSFHAYLTNQRIFLIDTQEKNLRVTAKDVARDTITGSIVEFSETSDPVLVLSIKSGDDEVKTMKLVFVQNGMDRASEIEEWISLLHEDASPRRKAPRRQPPVPEEPAEPEDAGEEEVADEEMEEEPVFVPPPPVAKPPRKHELQPVKKPLKSHERQPPVKRLLPLYKVPEEEPEPEPEPEEVEMPVVPPKKLQVRHVVASSYEPEPAPFREEPLPIPVRKPEVQSAMKVAMKSAMKQTAPVQQTIRTPVVESQRRAVPEPVPEPEPPQPRRPVVQESYAEKPVREEPVADSPQFCHNCGKKLPHSANFCPGCGTKLNQGRTLPHSRTTSTAAGRKATRTDPPGHEHRPLPADDEDEEADIVPPAPVRPPVKKTPKGSEMTILHKFLRR